MLGQQRNCLNLLYFKRNAPAFPTYSSPLLLNHLVGGLDLYSVHLSRAGAEDERCYGHHYIISCPAGKKKRGGEGASMYLELGLCHVLC